MNSTEYDTTRPAVIYSGEPAPKHEPFATVDYSYGLWSLRTRRGVELSFGWVAGSCYVGFDYARNWNRHILTARLPWMEFAFEWPRATEGNAWPQTARLTGLAAKEEK